MPIDNKTYTLVFIVISLVGFSCTASELPDGQESKQEKMARVIDAQTSAEYSSLDQQQKDDLFMGAVARNNIEQAGLLLESRARIDATSENIHLFLPENVLADLVNQMTQIFGMDPEQIRDMKKTEQMAGLAPGALEQRVLAEAQNTLLKSLGKKIRAVDVAVAHGHHDMVKFLFDHPARNRLKGSLSRFNSLLGGKCKKEVSYMAHTIKSQYQTNSHGLYSEVYTELPLL
jgi:hypothetical protein